MDRQELIDTLTDICEDLSKGHYERAKSLFELTKTTKGYPKDITRLAESFGLMLVNMETREFGRQQTIMELKKSRKQLHRYSDRLEQTVMRRTDELSRKNALLEQEISERCRVQAALETANEKLRRLSDQDRLTGIANRRRFDEILARECSRSHRTLKPVSLILCDIDYFKTFNDSFGHPAGDRCLQMVARVLKANCRRPGDLPARYGGEEFTLILPDTDIAGALDVARSVGLDLAELASNAFFKKCRPVTMSFGVACSRPQRKMSPEELIAAADKALYRAKAKGRNSMVADETAEDRGQAPD